MNGRDEGTGEVRDYVRQRMNTEMPPDFVGEVMHEVLRTPQRGGWGGWPIVAGLATVAAAVVAVGIGLSVAGPGGTGSTSPPPTVSVSQAPAPSASQPLETSAPSVSAEPLSSASQPLETSAPSGSPEPLPSGPFGPVWQMAPGVAFGEAQSCENPFGLPTAEEGENVAWRTSFPAGWTTHGYTGPCMWFGPRPWEPDLDDAVPPDEVAIVISLLDGRVTPTSIEFEGGIIRGEQRYTVDGLPAIRYEVEGSDGEFLSGDGVVWVIGVEGELPSFDRLFTPNYMTIFTSATEAGRLAQQVDVLDQMVATLEITD
ncbi:MAG: hypothetical protein M3406_01985 [Chloroflexota bacterium]|nr:hypothetical protein [Chloroflexota bacterium]